MKLTRPIWPAYRILTSLDVSSTGPTRTTSPTTMGRTGRRDIRGIVIGGGTISSRGSTAAVLDGSRPIAKECRAGLRVGKQLPQRLEHPEHVALRERTSAPMPSSRPPHRPHVLVADHVDETEHLCEKL